MKRFKRKLWKRLSSHFDYISVAVLLMYVSSVGLLDQALRMVFNCSSHRMIWWYKVARLLWIRYIAICYKTTERTYLKVQCSPRDRLWKCIPSHSLLAHSSVGTLVNFLDPPILRRDGANSSGVGADRGDGVSHPYARRLVGLIWNDSPSLKVFQSSLPGSLASHVPRTIIILSAWLHHTDGELALFVLKFTTADLAFMPS